MKTAAVVVILISAINVSAQQFVVGAQMEYTVSGSEAGVVMMYESKELVDIGLFYQRSEFSGEREVENGFYGAMLQLPIVKTEKLVFYGAVRGGIINREFFFVTPSIQTRINLRSRWGVGFGMGIRSGYPSASARLVHKLF